jgi:hypothetical protein
VNKKEFIAWIFLLGWLCLIGLLMTAFVGCDSGWSVAGWEIK